MSETERMDLAKSLGWADVRLVYHDAPSKQLRGFRPFKNAGVSVSVRDTVPATREGILALTEEDTPGKLGTRFV